MHVFKENTVITTACIFRPGVPVSPIFSLQINPLPDLRSLEKNPIMMMFDVVR